MFVEQALHQLLTANAAIIALVGTRVYPGLFPQTALFPALTYRLVRREEDPTLSASERTTGPVESQYVFYSAAKGATAYEDSKRLDEAVRLCISGFSGVVVLAASSPIESILIHGIFLADADEDFDLDTQTRQAMSLYRVRHSQTNPQ